MTTKQFTFTRNLHKRDGTIKETLSCTIRATDDGVVSFNTVQQLRIMLNRDCLGNSEGQDGYDVSGAGDNSSSQIIWQDGRFIVVPYNEIYVRDTTGSGKSIKSNQVLEYPMPIYKLADIHGVSPKEAIKVCQDCRFGIDSLTEYTSLTKEQANRAGEKIEEYKGTRPTDTEGMKEGIAGQYTGVRMSGSRQVQ